MASPIKLNLKIYQGSTFKQILRWESSTKVYVPITSISKSAPIVIEAPNHGIPVGWRAKVTNASGMKEINLLDYNIVTSTTQDTVVFNQINSLSFSNYTSGGVLEYNQPVPLTGLAARMQIREKLLSDTIIHELNTSNGGIVFDNTLKTITINIPDDITRNFSFTAGVYTLELEYPNGDTSTFCKGSVSLEKEVTR